MAVIQLKRGTAEALARVNPILADGEPGFVIGDNRLKIGDGVTKWNDLPYIGESSVFNASDRYGFPSVGRENVIYKSESEKKLYQWNSVTEKYDVIGGAEIGKDWTNIQIIHGGDADGE